MNSKTSAFTLYRTPYANEAGSAYALVAVGRSPSSGIQADAYYWFPSLQCKHGGRRFRYYTNYEVEGATVDEAFMHRQALQWLQGEIWQVALRASNRPFTSDALVLAEAQVVDIVDLWVQDQCQNVLEWIGKTTRCVELRELLIRIAYANVLLVDPIPPAP